MGKFKIKIALIALTIVAVITLFITNISSPNVSSIIEQAEVVDLNNSTTTVSTLPPPQEMAHDNSFECTSPLYVSDVLIDKEQFKNQSLVNLLSYFDRKGEDIDKVKLILLDSGGYTPREVRISSNIYSPPTYSTNYVDRSTLLSNVNKISSFGKNYKDLAEAVANGDVDPFMDLSSFYGRPKSIIDYFLEFRRPKPQIYFFNSLIESGVPVTHNTIISASNPNVSTGVLSLMIANLDDKEREYKWKKPGGEYTYASYASQFSTVDSLKIILSEGLGDKSDAINTLLKGRLELTNKEQKFDLDNVIKKNAVFNNKLSLLLEYDIYVNSDLIKEFLKRNKGISSSNLSALVNIVQPPIESSDKLFSVDLEEEVNSYIDWLKIAEGNWPEFVFSYDYKCKKVPSDSHYRYDNLINKEVTTRLVKENSSLNIMKELILFGDIYVDWYYSTLDLESPQLTISVGYVPAKCCCALNRLFLLGFSFVSKNRNQPK
jgi:hypothetical protein